MPKVTVDGQEIEVPNGTTILQACQQAGVEIPHFCYHERLAIAGNCRMCLVDVEKSPKPVASCAMPVAEGNVIHTQSERAKSARHAVMEMLLLNHPLDCPICDQGGECDLQDQAMAYGRGRSRYEENKRAVKDKDFGPLVATSMTRCIHCTRCIRFLTDVAGVEELGATGRGEAMEITTYVEKALGSEMSANIVDLCPVGALTSKPYAFVARPWELRKTESVDVLDAVGSNIRIDSRGAQVLRVLPRLNEDVNEEWISDKTRFAHDGLTHRRLDRPWIRRGGRLVQAEWREALDLVADRLKGTPGERIAAIAGDLCDAESMYALQQLMTSLGSPNLDCRQDGGKYDTASRASYLFNSTIAGIDEADAVLLIGTNPRWEAPIINTRLRKRYLRGGFHVAAIGAPLDLTYPVTMLGADGIALTGFANGDHEWGQRLRDAKAPLLILGSGAVARSDGAAVLGTARVIAESFGMAGTGRSGFNVLHRAASRVGGLDMGFLPATGGKDVAGILEGCRTASVEVLYLLGADELDLANTGSAFVIYQGHHGDRGAARADVVLPGCAYTEKDGTYVNTEGRAQLGRRAVFGPGEAREDWAILRAISGAIGRPLPFDSLRDLRAKLRAAHTSFGHIDEIVPAEWGVFGPADALNAVDTAAPFAYPITDFYRTDLISRASPTMRECSEMFAGDPATQPRTGTHG